MPDEFVTIDGKNYPVENTKSFFEYKRKEADEKYLQAVGKLKNLESLSIEMCGISDITPLKNLVELTHLGLGLNNIEKISPLVKMTKLVHLNLSGNRIKKIDPLAKLTNLETLSLVDNYVFDIRPLKKLVKLKFLLISAVDITDLSPLEELTSLEYLNLDVNEKFHRRRKWTDKEMNRLKLKLPNCRICFGDFDII